MNAPEISFLADQFGNTFKNSLKLSHLEEEYSRQLQQILSQSAVFLEVEKQVELASREYMNKVNAIVAEMLGGSNAKNG